jgi:UTP:GlnB (protein PII) uridylyltransferase
MSLIKNEEGYLISDIDPSQWLVKSPLEMFDVFEAVSNGSVSHPEVERTINIYSHKSHKFTPKEVREGLMRILRSKEPKAGIDLMKKTTVLARILPEFALLDGSPQSCQWHPEGDCYVHSCLVSNLVSREHGDDLLLAAFFHDIAKPQTALINKRGDVSHYGHDEVGAKTVVPILQRLDVKPDSIAKISDMIANHMKMHKDDMGEKKVKSIVENDNIFKMIELEVADSRSTGRNTDQRYYWYSRIEQFAPDKIDKK